jgi:hypothetical protein
VQLASRESDFECIYAAELRAGSPRKNAQVAYNFIRSSRRALLGLDPDKAPGTYMCARSPRSTRQRPRVSDTITILFRLSRQLLALPLCVAHRPDGRCLTPPPSVEHGGTILYGTTAITYLQYRSRYFLFHDLSMARNELHRPASSITRSAQLFAALGCDANASPRLALARAAPVGDAQLREMLARSYPSGKLPREHPLEPHRPSSVRGRPRHFLSDTPQWTWTAGGPRACLSTDDADSRDGGRGPPMMGQDAARDATARVRPGPSQGVRFAEPLELSETFALLQSERRLQPRSFTFQQALSGRSPGPACYEPPKGILAPQEKYRPASAGLSRRMYSSA